MACQVWRNFGLRLAVAVDEAVFEIPLVRTGKGEPCCLTFQHHLSVKILRGIIYSYRCVAVCYSLPILLDTDLHRLRQHPSRICGGTRER
jgi:hypothetical protein